MFYEQLNNQYSNKVDKEDNSPRRYLLSLSAIKKLDWFYIAGCGIATGSETITRRLRDFFSN